MSVSIYKNNECRYNIDKLEKVVYLISEDALRKIHIDDGEAYVDQIVQEPLSLAVYDIVLSDTDELDERYKFTHTLTFSMNGYANYRDFDGRYYAIVKTIDGVYWLVNLMFPCKVTYTYTLDANGSHTDFTLATISNHPTLKIHGINHATPYECGYRYCKFDTLRLNEAKYSLRSSNNIKYTNDGFKDTVFNKNSAIFTETFNGKNVSHSLQFNIKFDDYKSSWHYNLLEFMNNKYAAIIKSSCGKYILTGFNFGLQPSFTVTSNDDFTMDNIQINLIDSHDNGDFIGETYDEIHETQESGSTYQFTLDYDAYECVGVGVAKYLLKKEADILGNPTGNYKCLVGYEERFAFLGDKLVGTFSETQEFPNSSCGGDDCKLQTSFPDSFVFNTSTCRQYSLIADTDWSIASSNNGITVSPNHGVANKSYTVEVCNTITPTDNPISATLTVSYCEKTKVYNVTVEKGNSCFTAGAVFDISANAQYVTVPTSCCVQAVTDSSNTVTNIIIQNSYFKVYVPQNNTGSIRVITLTVTFCDMTTAEVIINQGIGFERWIKESTTCVGNQLCDVERKYTGTTASDINTRTNETRTVNCVVSSQCSGSNTRWIDTVETTCSGGRKYVVQAEQVSTDGGQTWTLTGNKRLGAETADSPAECEGQEGYTKWVVEGYMCEGTTKYAAERLYTSTDNTNWIATDTYRRTSTVLETDSTDCGYIHGSDTWKCEKWEVDDGYICEGTTKYAREQRYVRNCADCNNCGTEWTATGVYRRTSTVLETNSVDCGYVKPSTAWTCTKWEVVQNDYICEDGTKYTKERKYVRDCEDCNNCSAPWNATDVYRRGSTVLEENSTDCGYNPSVTGNCSEYRDDGDTICNGYDKYKYLRKYVRNCNDCSDCEAAWSATSIYKQGTLVQANSIDCGYIPTDTYERWVEDGYMCDGYSKYKRLRKYISDDNVQWYETNTYKRGDLIEDNSFDCGYIPTENYYEWRVEGTMCDGFNKYNRERKYISSDGNRWFQTDIYRRGSLIESNSTDCGYVPRIEYEYQWVITTTTTCVGYNKYYLYKKQRRVKNSGAAWEDVVPTETSYNGNGTMTPQLIEENSPDCGYTPPVEPKYKWVLLDSSQYMCDECEGVQYRWVTVNTYCVEINLYGHQKRQFSENGENWYDVTPEETQEVIVEYNSRECGSAEYKIVSFGKYNDPYTSYCNGSDMYTITEDDVLGNEAQKANVTGATIGTCGTAIATNAFYGTSITALTIPSNITNIGNNAFGYSDITEITFESSTPPTIGTLIFSHSSIETIYVPCEAVDTYKAVANLDSYVDIIHGIPPCDGPTPPVSTNKFEATYTDGTSFSAVCDDTTSLTRDTTTAHTTNFDYMQTAIVGSCVNTIGSKAFYNCRALTSVTIPNSVTAINNQAFYGCKGLTSISLPDSIVTIENAAFIGCTSLITVSLPNGLTSVNNSLFRRCTSLNTAIIPSTVTSIDGYVFDGCTRLTSITVLATTPPSITNSFINYSNNCIIYVPSGSVETYKSHSIWGAYPDRIQPIS